jgi:hypothetical protein
VSQSRAASLERTNQIVSSEGELILAQSAELVLQHKRCQSVAWPAR